ncbi:MAG TPA: hypothetical protein VI548_08840 [Chitinophagaceae bacterium]|nr:hypothetical protein [Chitinophagaceae bacterium]
MIYLGRFVVISVLLFSSGTFAFSQFQLSEAPGKNTEKSPIIKEETIQTFRIRKIYIHGNRKTKEAFIAREIPFKSGEEYPLPVLVKKFEDAHRQLMNTTLFLEVSVVIKSIEEYNLDILVELKERWYLFPIPFFKFVDRNFNQWLIEQNAKLDRVNYGLKVLYNNTSGNNDKLNVWIMNGYTKQISVSYDRLYFDRKMKWGLNTAFVLGKNREINYNTLYNKQQFYKDTNNYVRSFFRANAELTYRRAIRTRHRFGIAYTSDNVTDTIISLNPSYFENGRHKIVFPELYYTMNYADVDYIPFPLKGYMAEISLSKKGFNSAMDIWQLHLKSFASWRIANKTFFGLKASGIVKLPFKQPYYNQRLLGYNDFFMQGYEYFVVDGVAGGYLKSSITREVLNFNIHAKRKNKEDLFRIPFRVYAKVYGNAGYMYHPSPGANSLNNKMLYSGGLGIDIITHYDFTLKLEWSFNQLGQNDIYLHKKTYF